MRIQASLAERNDVTLVTLSGENTYVGQIDNDNSICQSMQQSPEHAKLCDLDCGTAYSRALHANDRIEYLCHASLRCFGLPVQKSGKPYVILGGRTFTSSATYSQFLKRYSNFNGLQTGEALRNVKFTDIHELTEISEQVSSTAVAHFEKAPVPAAPALEPDFPANLLDTHLEIIRLSSELENKNRALVQFQDFLRDVAPSLDSKAVYTEVLKKFNEILKAERSSLMLYNQEAEVLSLEAAVGADFEVSSKIRVRIGEGISGAVLHSGSPFLVRNIDTDQRVQSVRTERYKTKSFISYPITLGGRKFGVLNLTDRQDGSAYGHPDLAVLDLIAPQLALIIDRTEWFKKAEQYQQMSLTDPLTGLPNRRYLEERLYEEVERSKRHHTPLVVMLIDVDYFKNYNDRYGHTNADLVLIQVAQIFRRCVRTIDMPARYAGDEFCIILPETDVQSAAHIAERLCKEVRHTEFITEQGGAMNRVTLSIGVTALNLVKPTPLHLIQAADRALYDAKTRGRDQVVVLEE
jgi:diguanylate cyclase (GGDEF)-like protein